MHRRLFPVSRQLYFCSRPVYVRLEAGLLTSSSIGERQMEPGMQGVRLQRAGVRGACALARPD